MIIRIMEEGQYRLADAHLQALNDLDNKVVKAVEQDDRAAFRATFTGMLDFVRKNGAPLPVEELHGSDILIPRAETTYDEAKTLFVGEGLLPN
jgi:hypothetical protein